MTCLKKILTITGKLELLYIFLILNFMIFMVSKAASLLNKRLNSFLVNRLKWKDLNSIQDKAIPIILEGNDTLVISPTASGKTEAVLLPIFSEILDNHYEPLSVLYVAPLKALINDMYDRIDIWARHFNLTTTKWHGDVNKVSKDNFLKLQRISY